MMRLVTLLTLMLHAALAGLMVLVSYVLIQEAGYSGVAAGAALLSFPLVIATTFAPTTDLCKSA